MIMAELVKFSIFFSNMLWGLLSTELPVFVRREVHFLIPSRKGIVERTASMPLNRPTEGCEFLRKMARFFWRYLSATSLRALTEKPTNR